MLFLQLQETLHYRSRNNMSEQVYKKALEGTFNELTIETPEKNKAWSETVMDNYLSDLKGEIDLLFRSGTPTDEIRGHYMENMEGDISQILYQALSTSPEFIDKLYKDTYQRLKALAQEGKSYGDLFTEIYSDTTYLNELFVRLVEEQEGVVITSAKQLQELTGITELYSYFDSDKGEDVYYTGDREPTKEEAQEIALRQIEGAFTMAMSYRYSKALENILQAGGKYSDLLKVKPSYFNLPGTWEGYLPTGQYSSILWAIEQTFKVSKPINSVKPDLRTVAKEIEAPYSVLMDVYSVYSEWKQTPS